MEIFKDIKREGLGYDFYLRGEKMCECRHKSNDACDLRILKLKDGSMLVYPMTDIGRAFVEIYDVK